MVERYSFENSNEFLEYLKEIFKKRYGVKEITILLPYYLQEIEEIIKSKSSDVRYFSFIGAIAGLIFGFTFTILTSYHWPLIVGGKPIISIPAFIIIAFEMTILWGAVSSFIGFLLLSGLPDIKSIIQEKEDTNDFVIILEKEG